MFDLILDVILTILSLLNTILEFITGKKIGDFYGFALHCYGFVQLY